MAASSDSPNSHRELDPTKPVPIDWNELYRLVGGAHYDPHSILGAHPGEHGLTIRALRPLASSVTVILTDGSRYDLAHDHVGVWMGLLPNSVLGSHGQMPDYRLEVTYGDHVHLHDDPYRFPPTLGEVDLHLINEGRHEQLWTVLGSHVRSLPGSDGEQITGVSFAVWAPNAQGVRLVGDFNSWDGQSYPMRSLGSAGIWELFVPGLQPGVRYKYEIMTREGNYLQKADPMARQAELRPATASIVSHSTHQWGDHEWVAWRDDQRHSGGPINEAMSVYEVHLGSWRWGRSYRELADELVSYVTDLGFTHVEFMPVMEHPYDGSWGYHVTSYYAPTSRFGSPDDFKLLVDRLHQANIGVILDWVPGHFATDEWALMRFDGTPLYEHADPSRGWHPDWGSFIFDLGRNEVRNFLVANALYWLEEFHIDGLRVDGVASMLYLDYSREEGQWSPNQFGGREDLDAVHFLQEVNATCYRRHPGIIMVAEESTAWPGVTKPTDCNGLGFGFKWNMGWMHDTLDYLTHEPIHRQYHHHEMTFAMIYAYSENYILPLSHDEVVHGKNALVSKMPGDNWQQFANLRAYLGFMWAHPGKQLLFMGGEFGQRAEWGHTHELDWWIMQFPEHHGVRELVRDLNRVYRDTPALFTQDNTPEGFAWLDANDASGNIFAFLRTGSNGQLVACVSNFSPVPQDFYRLALPRAGRWREIINTDSQGYFGSGVGNLGQVMAEDVPHFAQPASVTMRVPPLGTVWLVYDPE